MNLKKKCYKTACYILTVIFFLQSVFTVNFFGNIGFTASAQLNDVSIDNVSNEYSKYLEKYSDYSKTVENIELKTKDVIAVDTDISFETFDETGDVIKWENGNGRLDFKFRISNEALYSIKLLYRSVDENVSEINVGFTLDGKYPYEALKDVYFPTFWKNETEKFGVDTFGNELTPKQIMFEGLTSRYAQDKTGIVTNPYSVYLSAGEHTLSIIGDGCPMYIGGVELTAYGGDEKYNETQPDDVEPINVEPIIIQAEHPLKKSSNSLLPMADTLDSRITPCDKKVSMLNYVGGISWQYSGDALEYLFDVAVSGYYKIGFMYKQSLNMNRNSYRRLTIDGKVPFYEANAIPFEYSTSWQFKRFSSEKKDDCLIWLDEGQHTLALEVTLGDVEAAFCKQMSDISDSLNSLYLEIIKITGSSPDFNRDYELFKQIPNFNEILSKNSEELTDLISNMETQGGSSEIAASLKNMKRVLEKMISRPYRAHDYVSSYYSAYSQVSTWLFDMKKMPLAVDEIQIVANNIDFNDKKSNFFKNLGYRISKFIYSFANDYNSVSGDSKSDKELSLWVTWGKDQASALDVMIKNDFTPSSGINVNVKIVGASLVNGLISGEFPDLLLNVSRTEPVNLGMRDALYDLKNFEDYEEVLKRFQPGSETPFIYNDACFALPDTQQFYVMIYRKDILENLGVDVPQNWKEFRNVAALIQRNNMEVYIPYTQITTNTTVVQGIGIMNLFPTLLKQEGLSLYSEDKRTTSLNDDRVIDVFEQWTKMYTDYQFVKESDFYNRFRMGIMPLGIVPYTTYFMIKEMAPEVEGKWSLALVPGTNGNRTITAGGSGCSIVNRSNKKEYAWEFLKWWTSADTQFEYSNRVESILGLVGRITTSNVEAFKRMEWERDQLDILLEQWSYVDELEEIPGSYYMIRSIDQSYWAVINKEMNAKDALSFWSGTADDEIERKYREYGN